MIYFSVLQRKALTRGDFDSRTAISERILGFQAHHEQVATPSSASSPVRI